MCLEHRRLELIPNTPSKLTKEVLRGLGTIESRFLFHAHTTITQRGGFSYKDRSTDDQIDALVDTNGSVAGMFRYRVLQEADVEQIVPLGSHKMVEYNIPKDLFYLIQNLSLRFLNLSYPSPVLGLSKKLFLRPSVSLSIDFLPLDLLRLMRLP